MPSPVTEPRSPRGSAGRSRGDSPRLSRRPPPPAAPEPADGVPPPASATPLAVSPFACAMLAHPPLAVAVIRAAHDTTRLFGCCNNLRALDQHHPDYDVVAAVEKVLKSGCGGRWPRIAINPAAVPNAVREQLPAVLYADDKVRAELLRPGVVEALQARGMELGLDQATEVARSFMVEHMVDGGDDELEEEDEQLLRQKIASLSGLRSGGEQDDALLTFDQLVERHAELRPAVVEGLLRKGEVMNLIGAIKSHKTYLVHHAALAIATGSMFLGRFPTTRSSVLILDNELHTETLGYRLKEVATAMRLRSVPNVIARSLRGVDLDLNGLEAYLEPQQERFDVCILDALYRFLPRGIDENSNADMAGVYTTIDRLAAKFGCSFILVHHASKGVQADKAVTDVGSGASTQARAADTHMVLRRHQEEDVVVLEASLRSVGPLTPACYRWQQPLFQPAEGLDPTDLWRAPRRKAAEKKGKPEKQVEITTEEFAERYLTDEPQSKRVIEGKAREQGVPFRKIAELMQRVVQEGLAKETRVPGSKAVNLQRAVVVPVERSGP